MEGDQNISTGDIRNTLTELSEKWTEPSEIWVCTLGFASAPGEEFFNFELSKERAKSVENKIRPKNGKFTKNGKFRILSIGMGENFFTGNQPLNIYARESRRVDVFACEKKI